MSGTPPDRTGSMPDSAADSAPPAIPDVVLLRCIGRGGFGQVWLGRNRATGALKAVKVIPLRGGTADPAGREIVSLSQLESQRISRHPHLLDIQHVGRTAEVLFYLMDPADDVSGSPASDRPDADAVRCASLSIPASSSARMSAKISTPAFFPICATASRSGVSTNSNSIGFARTSSSFVSGLGGDASLREDLSVAGTSCRRAKPAPIPRAPAAAA
jgi:hypothetical protein